MLLVYIYIFPKLLWQSDTKHHCIHIQSDSGTNTYPKLFQEVRFLYGNKPSLRVITGRAPVLGATPALSGLTVWHRCSEVRRDIPAFGVASGSLNLALADLQSGSGRASVGR